MRPYRNGKTFQARRAGGQFRQWDLDRDFGTRECPWCHMLSAHQPDVISDHHGFIDPAEFNRRVCRRCGWDSAEKHAVGPADLQAAVRRCMDAKRELEAAADNEDPDAIKILTRQFNREANNAQALLWLGDYVV